MVIRKQKIINTESAASEETPLVHNTKSPMQKVKKIVTKKNILVVLFLILAVGFIYYFVQYRKLSKTPAEVAKEKTATVIKQISELAVVPNDPNAVLANVSDVTKLKGQTFFDNAQNGDEIVIFPSAMRAILYRPSINKIINIGPLSSNPTGTGTASAPTTATTVATDAAKTPTKPISKTTPKK